MKKIFTIIAAVLLTVSVFAQSPEKISYQAVIRDASSNLVINQAVGMQISILQETATGIVVYSETQTPTTNANGLVSIEIGTGFTSDDFSSIDWSNDIYFIKTETDPEGGINYSIIGTSQLLSVPYALHAKTAETIAGGIIETDPIFTAWDKSTGVSITESQITDLQTYLTTEIDPQFASWDKATGIVITESQISDLQTYLTVETDPSFTAWDKSTGVSITESQITDLQAYLIAEVDPQFASWDKTTGIVITESQISDLQTYLTVETDPSFTAWDKSTGVSITESQITDLQAYLTAEVDPQFALWDKATGIVITESQISDLQTYLTAETDPSFTAWDKSTGVSITESQITDLQAYLIAEVDPQFASWDKATGIVITESQISDLQTYLTVETDPSFTSWDKSTGVSITESQISDLTHTVDTDTQLDSTDIANLGYVAGSELPSTVSTGDMMYYDGADWQQVVAGTTGQLLTMNASNEPEWQNPSSLKSAGTNNPTMDATGVIFHGVVNANDLSTTVAFEYGTDLTYGTTVVGTPNPVTGTTNTAVTSALITGFDIGTTYHVRLITQNIFGTFYSNDITFCYMYIGAFYFGGGGMVFLIYDNGLHGFVCDEYEHTYLNWEDALAACGLSTELGFNDWFLPSKTMLNYMYENLGGTFDIGDFSGAYWSSTMNEDFPALEFIWFQNLSTGYQFYDTQESQRSVRAIRYF